MTPTAPATPRRRNRLMDIFRGIALLLIFVAHMPGNDWKQFIPGAWGFSDATEIFVFVSGMAVGYAFYPAFARDGFATGTLRVARRAWQVYLAHLGLFFAVAALLSAADFTFGGTTHIDFINLRPFFDDPQRNLIGLLTLTYVPNLFDILPMYIVILALVPALVALARIAPRAPLLASGLLYAAANLTGLNLPAEPWTDRQWFFDPFGWQFLFAIGLSFTAGWLQPPRLPAALVLAALAFVLLAMPVANFEIRTGSPFLDSLYTALLPYADKTTLGPLRLLHFFALTAVVLTIVGTDGNRLTGPLARWLEQIGQQSLIVFVTGTFLAQVCGVLIFETSNTWVTTLAATMAGFVLIYAIARIAARIKAALQWSALPARATDTPGGQAGG